MKIEFVINPKFGKDITESKIEIIKEMFSGYDISFYLTKNRASTLEHVSSSESDVIISVGGDGTLNEVINGVMRAKKRPIVGAIPFGTSNVYATELRIPIDTREACRRILKGLRNPRKIEKIDIGLVNDEFYFVMWASIGPDATISRRVDNHTEDKKTLGRLAFVIYGIPDILMYDPPNLSIKTENYVGRGHFVIVANGTHYAGKYVLSPNGTINDGLFDVFIFKGDDPMALMKYFVGIATGSHIKYDDVVHKKAKEVEASFLRPVWMHVDSEAFKVSEFKVKMIHDAARFL